MSINFTNTNAAGYVFGRSGDDSLSKTTPSTAANGSLFIGFVADEDNTLGASNTASISNITGETVVASANAGSKLSASLIKHQFTATPPSTIDFAESSQTFNNALSGGFVFTGHDTSAPIRASATNSGTGTTVTFPDTAAVNNGDFVLRFAAVWSDDFVATFSGFADTQIYSDPNSAGAYGVYSFAGYKVMSSNAAPGTTTLTVSRSVNWVAFTVVIARGVHFVQSRIGNGVGNTPAQLAFTSNVSAGSLLIAVLKWQNGTAGDSSTSTNMTKVPGSYIESGAERMVAYYKENATAGAFTPNINIGTGGSSSDMLIAEFTGVATSSSFSAVAKAFGTGSSGTDTVSSGSTTVTVGDLLIGTYLTTNNFGDMAAGTGFTRHQIDTGWTILVESRVATGTSHAATFSPTNSQTGGMYMLAFHPTATVAAPTITAGPTVSSISASGFDVAATFSADCTMQILVTAVGASQPSDAAFDASTETGAATAGASRTVHHTGQ